MNTLTLLAFALFSATLIGPALANGVIDNNGDLLFTKNTTVVGNSWTRSPASKTPASPSNSIAIPTITTHFAASYQNDLFQVSFSESSPNSPIATNAAEIISAISEASSQYLASDFERELKVRIFRAYHIAAIANIVIALTLIIFFWLRAMRDLIRSFKDQ